MKKTVLALWVGVTPLTKATISRAFKPNDFEILWAGNESEAVKASTRHHFDLLLLELNQPLRAGRGIVERLRTLNAGVPVVILTEYKSAYEEAVADQAGAVLQKPFNVAALAHAINGLLGNSSSSNLAPTANQAADQRDLTAQSNHFREMLHQRYTTPFVSGTPYQRWGINE